PFDPGTDGVYRGEPLLMLLLDGHENLPAIWVEPIPGIVHRRGAAEGSRGRGGADRWRHRGRSSPRTEKLLGQAQLGARRLAPCRPANQLALERISVEKISDATAETAQEETGRRCPMANEKGGLIDDRKAEPTFRKDRPRPLPASARVEIVTMEKK